MKARLILLIAVSAWALVVEGNLTCAQNTGPAQAITWGGMVVGNGSGTPVEGAPYSATITVNSVRTLADGNQIVQTSVGATARDSLGRTREEPPVPSTPPDAPHVVFIQDPATHTAYVLNLADKTAQKLPWSAGIAGEDDKHVGIAVMRAGDAATSGDTVSTPAFPTTLAAQDAPNASTPANSEDLGSRTMEGLTVTGVRTTRTILAGKVGNTEPIKIVTEVWTSPALKTVVYSKRSDPITGEDTFELSNISQTEPDPSLFTVPSEFKAVDNPTITLHQPSARN